MSVREVFLVVHRWLGIAVGVFFGIASLTGAVLVFEPELQDLLTRRTRATQPGDVGAAAVEALVRREFPAASITFFRPPQGNPGLYRVDLATEGGTRTVFVSAGTGQLMPAAREQSRLIVMTRRLHTNLMGGRPGSWFVTYTTLIAVIGMLSGIVLWWPGLRRIARGFIIRLRRTFYILNYDLHQVVGIVALPLLLLIMVTGVLLPFGGVARRLGNALYGERQLSGTVWPEIRVHAPSVAGRSEPLPIEDLLASARSAVPDGRPLGVVFPRGPRSPIDARMQVGGVPSARSVASVFLDPYSGEVLQVRDPRALPPGDRLFVEGYVRLHVGGFESTIVRALYALACVAGVLLVPTGLIVWWLKRTRLELAAERRRTRVALR